MKPRKSLIKFSCKEWGHLCQGRPNLHLLYSIHTSCPWLWQVKWLRSESTWEKVAFTEEDHLLRFRQLHSLSLPRLFTTLVITLGKLLFLNLGILLINVHPVSCLPYCNKEVPMWSQVPLQTLGYLVVSAKTEKQVLATIYPMGPKTRQRHAC